MTVTLRVGAAEYVADARVVHVAVCVGDNGSIMVRVGDFVVVGDVVSDADGRLLDTVRDTVGVIISGRVMVFVRVSVANEDLDVETDGPECESVAVAVTSVVALLDRVPRDVVTVCDCERCSVLVGVGGGVKVMLFVARCDSVRDCSLVKEMVGLAVGSCVLREPVMVEILDELVSDSVRVNPNVHPAVRIVKVFALSSIFVLFCVFFKIRLMTSARVPFCVPPLMEDIRVTAQGRRVGG